MLTTKEAQAMLGISLRYLYELVSRGEIAHYRFGRTYRFEEAQIQAYKESCAVAVRVPKETAVIRGKASLPGEKSELELYFEKHRLERQKLKAKNKPKK